MKQYAPACDRNTQPIVAALSALLPAQGSVLEVGSGTGQHIVSFARIFPELVWQPTDLNPQQASIDAWCEEADLDNVLPFRELNLLEVDAQDENYEAIVCINTIHIVSMQGVKNLFSTVSCSLKINGVFIVYGPYRYADRPLEPSNESFELWLKNRDPQSGIRNFEEINHLAAQAGLKLEQDLDMPANNRLICWRKN